MEKLMNGRIPVLSFVSGRSSSSHTWIKEIWDYVQNDPQYKDKTALVLPTDHHGDTVKQNGQVMEISLKGLQEYILRLWDQKLKVEK
jgi:hypothetical protein